MISQSDAGMTMLDVYQEERMKERKKKQEKELIKRLLHGKYISIKEINSIYPNLHFRTPYDLFNFCRMNDIWLKMIDGSPAEGGWCYRGLRLKTITVNIPE